MVLRNRIDMRNLPSIEFAEEYVLRGDNDAAKEICEELIPLVSCAVDFARIGNILAKIGEVALAQAAYQKALAADAESAPVQSAIGSFLLNSGDCQGAIRHLQKAIALDPSDPARLTILAVAKACAGEEEESIDLLRAVLTIDPDYEEAHYNLAVSVRDSDPDLASAHLRKAIALDSRYAMAHRELAFVLMGQGHFSEAESHLDEAVRLEPNDFWKWIYWGTLRWQLNDAEGAKGKFEIAISMRPELGIPKWSLGALYEDMGDNAAALALYRAALDVDPEDEIASEKLSRLSSRLQ